MNDDMDNIGDQVFTWHVLLALILLWPFVKALDWIRIGKIS